MKDPVCGMDIEAESAAAQAEHNGKIYYFSERSAKKSSMLALSNMRPRRPKSGGG